MESQLQHTQGRHYDEHDKLTAGLHTGYDHNEGEHHGEKKSVIKKVKEKAKKLKNTITKHGHAHDHHHHDDEKDDDDDETVEDPEVHGAPMYDSARVGPGGPDAIFGQPGVNLEKPSVLAEDRCQKQVASHGAAPQVSTGDYGSKLSERTGGLGYTETYSHEVNPEKWRGKIGQPTGMEEDPFAPNPTRVASPIGVTDPKYGTRHLPDPAGGLWQDVNQGGLRSIIGELSGMDLDPNAPKRPSGVGSDPSNYETKVTNPTRAGGKEADLSQIKHSLDKVVIGYEPKCFDPNHPENLPRETLTRNQESQSSSYADKISSSASAIGEKAALAKDVIASKLGYSGQNPTTKSHETVKDSSSTTDYAHKLTDKVTGTVAPLYEKVVDAGSTIISKVQGTMTGAGTGTEQPQVHGGADTGTALIEKGADVGVSVKEYLVETLTPGDDDKALKEMITHAFHQGSEEESEKKSSEDRPMGRVTESVEVRQRLGTDRRDDEQRHHYGNVSADKGVTERLSEAVGSLFGGKGDAPQGTLGTSYVTDEGLSSNPTGDQSRVGGKDQRV